MLTLFTKDGTKTGNAILIGGRLNLDGKYVFLVETDFGNRIEITGAELVEMFTPGRICEYESWDRDRAELRDSREESYQCIDPKCPVSKNMPYHDHPEDT